MTDSKPPSQNPALPDFWDQRYRTGVTPWDAGRVPAALQDFVSAGDSLGAAPRVLIPGCGSAWEARLLCERGWDVLAIDFSEAAIEAAKPVMAGWPTRLRFADFFAFDAPAPFDLIYERAFLCALPRGLWPDYAARCAALLRAGGLLAGFFYFGSEPKGPPFAIEADALDALLVGGFERIEDKAVEDSLSVFAGRERWQVWRRRG